MKIVLRYCVIMSLLDKCVIATHDVLWKSVSLLQMTSLFEKCVVDTDNVLIG
jgi:hypothetical protein